MDMVLRLKGFLLEPLDTFDVSKEDAPKEAIKFYAALAAIFSVLSAVMSVILSSRFGPQVGFGILGILFDAGTGTDIALLTFIFSLILILLWGAILHIFIYLLGGKKGIIQTIKAAMYGSAPGLLSGWIPLLGIIGFIWASVLMIIGIRQFQELTTGKAIVAVLVPIVVLFILVIAIAVLVAQFVMRMGALG